MKQSFKSKVFREIKKSGPIRYVVSLALSHSIFEEFFNGSFKKGFFLLGTMDYLSGRYGLNPLPEYDYFRTVRPCDKLFEADPEVLNACDEKTETQSQRSPIPEFARFGIYVDESEFAFIDTLQKDKDRLH